MSTVYIHGYDLVAGKSLGVAGCADDGRGGQSYEQLRSESLGQLTIDLPLFPLHQATEVALAEWLEQRPSYRRYLQSQDRIAQLGCFAARQLTIPEDFGVIAGTSRGVSEILLASYRRFIGDKPLSPKVSPLTTGSALAAALGQVYQLSGMTTAVSAACSSGLHALGTAASLVRTGSMAGALVVAAEACLDPFTVNALAAAKVQAHRPGYRPFSAERSGLALGEGAAALTISPERPPSSPVIEVAGFASCRETATMTGISADAGGLQRAIAQALSQAGIAPSDVDLIVSHGAGTIRGDAAEFACYQRVFAGSELPPIQHYKWLLGHSLGATGLQAIALALQCWQDEAFIAAPYSLDFPFTQLPAKMPEQILVCSLGFGGICSAIVLRRTTF